MKQLWGSMFSKPTEKLVKNFNSSLSFDKRLYEYDIKGSIAHVKMLGEQNIIDANDVNAIVEGLICLADDIQEGKIPLESGAEDIHTFLEKALIEKIGDVGKKMHTGRSRNDQVALDLRMYVKCEANNIQSLLIKLITSLLNISKEHLDTIMPGYTHMQKAQPITFSHHLGAYIEMFKRDHERLTDAYKRINKLPLGSGALATCPYNIDRFNTMQQLQFEEICLNSIDAVSDRDFVIEILNCLSIVMMHLSRFCEEIILWSSYEFKFITIDDGYATGSSIMPQKKNPDVAELIRGKTGRVYGSLFAMLTTMKSLPLAYNKDLQEDKECLFDAVDTVKNCLEVFDAMLKTIAVNKEIMYESAQNGFLNATDVADYLVLKNIPFRDAHEITGKIILYCTSLSKNLDELTLDEFKKFNLNFEMDIFDAISIIKSLEKRKVVGGPAPETMKNVILLNEEWLKNNAR